MKAETKAWRMETEKLKNNEESESEVDHTSFSSNNSDTEDTQEIESETNGNGFIRFKSSNEQQKAQSVSLKHLPPAGFSSDDGRGTKKPTLHKSLFTNVPPTINFFLPNELPEKDLHLDRKHLLIWRLSSVTPSIVRKCVR